MMGSVVLMQARKTKGMGPEPDPAPGSHCQFAGNSQGRGHAAALGLEYTASKVQPVGTATGQIAWVSQQIQCKGWREKDGWNRGLNSGPSKVVVQSPNCI